MCSLLVSAPRDGTRSAREDRMTRLLRMYLGRMMRRCGLLAMTVLPLAPHAQAPVWPTKPVRIVVASGPGSGDDFVVRLLAPKLSESFNQQFITENRPGAGGVIGQ